jgi:hypothetical protein
VVTWTHVQPIRCAAVRPVRVFNVHCTRTAVYMKSHMNNGLIQCNDSTDAVICQGPKLNSLYNYQCRGQSQIFITLNNIWAINNVDVCRDNKISECLSNLRIGRISVLYTLQDITHIHTCINTYNIYIYIYIYR